MKTDKLLAALFVLVLLLTNKNIFAQTDCAGKCANPQGLYQINECLRCENEELREIIQRMKIDSIKMRTDLIFAQATYDELKKKYEALNTSYQNIIQLKANLIDSLEKIKSRYSEADSALRRELDSTKTKLNNDLIDATQLLADATIKLNDSNLLVAMACIDFGEMRQENYRFTLSNYIDIKLIQKNGSKFSAINSEGIKARTVKNIQCEFNFSEITWLKGDISCIMSIKLADSPLDGLTGIPITIQKDTTKTIEIPVFRQEYYRVFFHFEINENNLNIVRQCDKIKFNPIEINIEKNFQLE